MGGGRSAVETSGPPLARQSQLPAEHGAIVTAVGRDTPAGRAGLRPSDGPCLLTPESLKFVYKPFEPLIPVDSQ
jgi:hypothetical protein